MQEWEQEAHLNFRHITIDCKTLLLAFYVWIQVFERSIPPPPPNLKQDELLSADLTDTSSDMMIRYVPIFFCILLHSYYKNKTFLFLKIEKSGEKSGAREKWIISFQRGFQQTTVTRLVMLVHLNS